MTVETATHPDLGFLAQGAAEVLPGPGALAALLSKGKPLRVKLGFDPTRPDLHLGHAVVLQALRRFQDRGHQVVVIIGDFTARIGDPTGKKAARPPLTEDEVRANAQTYLDQLWLVLDRDRTEVRYNAEWLGRMGMTEAIQLLAKSTLHRMMERDDFAKRWDASQPIHLHELLYPLLQGQDSVEVRADIEMGGTDQKFNNLMGRQLQEVAGQAPQLVMLYPILVGLDGVEKMSKSLDNYIGLTDPPDQMYGKVMSLSDAAMPDYFRLAAGLAPDESAAVVAQLAEGRMHPRDGKMRLAHAVAALYHGPQAADRAQEGFVRQFQKRELPEEMEERHLEPGHYPVVRLLVDLGMASGTGEARRVAEQGGVKLHRPDVEPLVLKDPKAEIVVADGSPMVLQVGKRRFCALNTTWRGHW